MVERLAVPVEWVLGALDQAVIATDLEGTVHYWNPAAERLYGWKAQEAVGRNVAELTSPQAVNAAREDVMEALRQGSRWSGEFTVRRRQGDPLQVSVTELPVFDGDGALVGTVGLSTDVSEARDELHLRQALSEARVGTWRRDPATDAVEWDPTTEAMHGLERGTFAGTIEAWLEAVHPEDRERVAAHLGDEVFDYRTAASAGRPVWVEARGRGSVGVLVDITDRKRAEAVLREEHQIIETLHHIGTALAAELELDRIVQAVTDAATLLTGAQFGAFFYNVAGPTGEWYTLYTLSGVDPSAFSSFPMPRNTKVFAPTFSGDCIVRLDDVTADARYGQNPPYNGMPEGHLPVRSYLAVPVVSHGGEVHGGLFFGHEDPGVFDERDERIVVGIAGHAAIAIHNARLYETAQRERRSAEAAAERLARLNAMAYRLAEAATVDDVAAAIVSEAGDALAAQAVVCAKSEVADHLELLAVSADDAGADAGSALEDVSAHLAASPVSEAYATGELVLTPTSAAVPFEVEGQTYGALGLTFGEERVFSDDDRSLLVALGLLAGQALGRARLADAERKAARTLQQSLLPPGELVVPGLEVATRYHAFGDATEVGGDFYDVFAIGDGGYGVVMGDVRGKGIQSAAITALARYTVRTATQCGQCPSEAVRLVNKAIFEQDDPERFCTIVHFRLEPGEAGCFDIELVCGGHPLPLLLQADGSVRSVGRPGTVVGLFEDPELHDVQERLHPGDVLVLYTDGVLEARSPDGRFEPGLLERALREAAGGTAEEVASAIERAVLRFEGGLPRDDMAIVVLRVPA